MITLHVEKLYRYPRIAEHMSVAVPFKRGELTDISKVCVFDGEKKLPVQCKVTASYPDASVKYLLVRFVGDLPGNAGKEFQLDYCRAADEAEMREFPCGSDSDLLNRCNVEEHSNGIEVTNGALSIQLKNNGAEIFHYLTDGNCEYNAEHFVGPLLQCREEEIIMPPADMQFGCWQVLEEGPLCVILKNKGIYRVPWTQENAVLDALDCNGNISREIAFETKLTVWAGKPWVEVSHRLTNTSEEELNIGALGFYCRAESESPFTGEVGYTDSTGNVYDVDNTCNTGSPCSTGNPDGEKTTDIYRTKGVTGLSEIEQLCLVENVRTCTGYSNYKTDFTVGANGASVTETVTSKRMMSEMNEHFSEVFYGTFFADRTDARGGICATVYQAQQNFPKAVCADEKSLAVMLVPEGEDRVVMQPGMSREQRFLLHFHDKSESLAELDNRSLIYQMPDRPVIAPQVFRDAGVMPDIFPMKMDAEAEIMLIRKADGHNRVFGMLNWGDTYDANYSAQGRGGGRPVWVNNEYDYPHACALMYARTGTRRFLDYLLVSASHWMDVDVCHYSNDPLRLGGQVEHTRGHVVGGKVIVSHEWVEGLLDYYHFTGDERGLETAMGIGENVLRLLNTPQYAGGGEISARETGWALRTFTALYVETGQERWLEKCEWIVGHFKEWEKNYGHWLSPYTDNTLIRVGFMISVAVGSLMRYQRVRPGEEIRGMILRAIDDLVENCRLENGLFYYKELPSLARLGGNTLLLEAMAIGYELTGDKKYLEAGMETYRAALREGSGKTGGARVHVEDAVIWPGESAKAFGQSFLPLACFDVSLEKAGMR